MGERLERFGRNAERFAWNDWNGERNGEWFARNDWNGERNAERFAQNGFLTSSSTFQGLYFLESLQGYCFTAYSEVVSVKCGFYETL
jgi:hypothetical protein